MECFSDIPLDKVEFIIEEDSPIPDSINRIKIAQNVFTRTFTSLAKIATKYEWDFGDDTKLETSLNPVTHDYTSPGTYTVKHKACLPAANCPSDNPICCCSPECRQTLQITLPVAPAGLGTLVGLGLLVGFLFTILRPKKM